MQYDIQQINHLIRHRRSVFTQQFVPGKPIDESIIQNILENATWAPNHGHTEPWHFTVFAGAGLQKLANFQASIYKEHAGAAFKQDKYLKLQQQPLLCSHIIAIGCKRGSIDKIPVLEEVEAVACAVQNIALSVHAYGLGGYWSSGGITYIEQAKSFFGLGAADQLLGFFYIGHIATPSAKAIRSPLSSKVQWITT